MLVNTSTYCQCCSAWMKCLLCTWADAPLMLHACVRHRHTAEATVQWTWSINAVNLNSWLWYLPIKMTLLWYLLDDRPPLSHEYCIWFSFEAQGPCRVTCDRGTGRKQGSEPGNRLVKEPATTASSMGYKQHWVDLKQSAEGGRAG